MIQQLEHLVLSLADRMHLAIFAPVSSFIEEVIPPIPSPSMMIATGSMAQVQHYTILGLIVLAILGAIGKTIGATVVYFVIDKIEDYFSSGITKFFGVTHEQIEALGAKLSRSWKDYVLFFVLRSLPMAPSTLISVGAGLLKVRFKLFFFTTLAGSFVREFLYIYVGYVGLKYLQDYVESSKNIEAMIQVLVIGLAIAVGVYLIWRSHRKS